MRVRGCQLGGTLRPEALPPRRERQAAAPGVAGPMFPGSLVAVSYTPVPFSSDWPGAPTPIPAVGRTAWRARRACP